MSAGNSKIRKYKAIIWTGDPNAIGQRIAIEAESLEDARKMLLQQFGDDATISLWNEEDAQRAR